mmetsp:Transcript_18528/g.73962  ORF Transcript_18528/g.73962 Transcript_18528/m.73962 type:complete len:262 (-) Transcript_18528:524-1309(-)
MIISEQGLRRAALDEPARVEDEHEVGVGDGRDAVRDDEHGAPELGRLDVAEVTLDARVGRGVGRRGALVERQDLAVEQQRAREADELCLARAQVVGALGDGAGEQGRVGGGDAARVPRCGRRLVRRRFPAPKADAAQRRRDGRRGVLAERVDVGAERAGEEVGVLRDDGDPSAHDAEWERREVDAAHEHRAARDDVEPAERQSERRLAAAGAPAHADRRARGDVDAHAAQHVGQVVAVPHAQVAQLDARARRGDGFFFFFF